MSCTTCWGRVEEFLAAGELWNDHKKVIFFPCLSATTCATHPLGVDQRSSWRLVKQEIAHTKPFFFPVASAATCTDSHLEVDQR
ncbi:hypothetical protein Taro_016051 [Colocasia esculenta]|uniref:Uncharacterized protein n=1 Tax=Colocasia esculenta TaxID=4460 RepID=A0A843UP61_COLES|nr:hypothetical protein [Colocasia esculenta]